MQPKMMNAKSKNKRRTNFYEFKTKTRKLTDYHFNV